MTELSTIIPLNRIDSDVRKGLCAHPKRLPAWLFYDAEGSRLFEQITELPEYYLTRAERSIFEQQSDAIVEAVAAGGDGPLNVLEFGAGTATKSEVLLQAVVRRQGEALFIPADVSGEPLEEAKARFARSLPAVDVQPLIGPHEDAIRRLARLAPRQLALFIGSSIGNFDDRLARSLLSGIASSLRKGGVLLLGTDLRKHPAVLLPAYDDAAGVTAAFNRNVLVRINRELGGRFDLSKFKHTVRWNPEASRVEMHLESQCDQQVPIEALGIRVPFRRGETIHTESSVKYDETRVDALFATSGFVREKTFFDDERRFALHLARVC